jgi:hypothetical protein
MRTATLGDKTALVELTRDDLLTINNALNEVCNGIHLEGEFDTRMGCSVEEARGLLAEVNQLIKSLPNSN